MKNIREQQARLQKEINSNKVSVDRTCFKKEDHEKILLKHAKKQYKANTGF